MFGMGFTEILIIAVIAILFLGPDKLPSAMIDIAKFFRNTKNAIGSVKDTLEEEMHLSDIKKEALAYKDQLESASTELHKVTDIRGNLESEIDSLISDDDEKEVPVKKSEEVTFKKKKKEDKKAEKPEKIEDEFADV